MPDPSSSDDSNPFLPGTQIEVVTDLAGREFEYVLFDFDGTLSLIREGWPEIMVPMMVEMLQATGTSETSEELSKIANNFVMELNGKQTIYQMMRLAEEVKLRGGTAQDPLDYKQEYHRRLMERVEGRRDQLRNGQLDRQAMLVPGSIELLDLLRDRNLKLYLASGTDENYVKEEITLLGLDEYFGDHIYGALDDYKSFSKAMIIERILTEFKVPGDRLLGFGDGYVEIENIKSVGGTAVGVASDEANRSGQPDPWKRNRLLGVGADLIVPDFSEASALVQHLLNSSA